MSLLNRVYVIAIMIMLVLVGCSNQNSNTVTTSPTNDETLQIYTTLYPLEDFTKKIGQEHVEVVSVIPAGADAHTFEPTPKKMIEIANANLFIYSSNQLENYVDSMKDALEKENVKFVATADKLMNEEQNHSEEEENHSEEEKPEENEHEDSDHDQHDDDLNPHVWLDPTFAIELAEEIKDALAALKPEAKDDFENNFLLLKEKLTKLDHQLQTTIEQAERREILVSHAAYSYWESRYGINQIAVAGISSTNEPSQKQLAEIIETANEHQIKYILLEQNVKPKVTDVIKNELNATPLQIHNLSVLTDNDITNGEDYFSLMEKNLETLKIALN
ncbi:metal ABC transporter solute-binding protein, Zn/Mn family [Cytobacillus sp. IB215665]|uniref:metal ABC transporter solute-binding protein, Zn/Mn family n=1 Tax=Cytobacillus sp. IB215665 TaxID=3097357 RepID=UPI002A11F08B|nr:zinc ABC transporter substrate-binding protein [Cytobacillus sp. IB215665]MDX8366616.1 zinc ABC transporter substrate-binding protein [Cytobacillus sp. IB215665]